MSRLRSRESGISLVEAVFGAALLAGILLVGLRVLRSTAEAARSTNDVGIAANSLQKALIPVADTIRRASLATIESSDGTAFAEGHTQSSIRLRTVTGYTGVVQLAEPVTVRFDLAPGAETGDIVLDDGLVPVVLSHGVTSFQVTRNGSSFLVEASARSGPADDRVRNASGSIAARPRNP